MPPLSVIICTHSPDPARLQRVLAGLQRQTLPLDRWELLLIDNDSQPPLTGAVDLGWHPKGRVVAEPRRGLTHARLRSMAEAAGDILLYVDDDMVLEADYLERSLSLYEKHPFIGALGGFGTGEFAQPPDPWLNDFRVFLLDFGRELNRQMEFQYAMTRQPGPWVPIGAGMSVRRVVVERYRAMVETDEFRKGLGRKGQSLCGSEDADLAYTAIDCGLACASSALLKFVHIIPASRMTPAYMERLLYTSQYFTARLLVHRGWKNERKLPPESWWVRTRRALSALLPRPPRDRCWRAYAQGYQDGISGRPLAARYT